MAAKKNNTDENVEVKPKRTSRKKIDTDTQEETKPKRVSRKKKDEENSPVVAEMTQNADISTEESSPSGENSNPQAIQLFDSGVRLVRKRGTFRENPNKSVSDENETDSGSQQRQEPPQNINIKGLSRKRGFFMPKEDNTNKLSSDAAQGDMNATGAAAARFAAHQQDESPKEQFVPKKLDFTPNYYLPGTGPARDLSQKISRRKGTALTNIQASERLERYSGVFRNHVQDRPPCLQNIFVPEEEIVDKRITPEMIHHLVSELGNADILSRFSDAANYVWLWNVVRDWYHRLELPDEALEPQPLSDNSNAFVPKTIEQVTTPVADEDDEIVEPGPDPVIEAIFEIFNDPIVPIGINSSDEAEIRSYHCAAHAGRITKLFGDWARCLEYIDKNVTGGPENKYLSDCFLERFQNILAIDYDSAQKQGVTLPDLQIKNRFYLDDIDLLLLWLMAGFEIDPEFRNAMRSTWDQQTIVYMSSGTLMRFFCTNPQERADLMARLAPSSVMASAGLFRIVQGSVPTQPLSFEIIISEQIIRQFVGVMSLSVASTQYAELVIPDLAPDTFMADTHEKTFDIIRNYLDRPSLNKQHNLRHENLDFIPSLAFLVEGLPGSGRATLVKIVASRLNRPVIILQGSPLAGIHPTDCEEYLKSLFTDASLMNAFICVRDAGPLLTEERTASIFARQLAVQPVVCAFCVELAVKVHPVIEPYVTFKTKMDANLKDSAVSFWLQHLNLPNLDPQHIDVVALSQRMALQPFQIQKATKLAYYSENISNEHRIEVTNSALEKAAAVQVTKNIGNLAFVSDPEIDLTDVIVSDDIMEKIKQIIGSAINRRRVLYEWGLSKRIRRGTGVIALFDGEPGTGKTHSAEAIAHELGLSLMRINIATMVDKYIGETEKNLTTIFEQARPDMQLLLFDEADSLFTKRTANVSKSNDRYSNMSVNVLLQLVERYEGVSILTTNLKNAIDPAFERRITYKVYFPMPKQPERERLWRYMCPPEIVTAEPIDYEWLSELEMSGGEIKNAVLTAAFIAATQGELLNSEILYNAGVAEAVAAGRVLRRYESGEDFHD